MFDEMQRLIHSEPLFELLSHYVQLGKQDRQVWQDRMYEFDGLKGRPLAKLYGELIAYGWLEQNTGSTPILEAGRFACCYRVTPAGRRAVKEAKKAMTTVGVN